jgi:hypothetical protein
MAMEEGAFTTPAMLSSLIGMRSINRGVSYVIDNFIVKKGRVVSILLITCCK